MGMFDEVRAVSKESQLNYEVVTKPDKNGKNRKYIVGKCESCGKPYEKRKGGTKHKTLCAYCARSMKCKERTGEKGPRKGKEIKCSVCKKPFYVIPSRVLSAKYCSYQCHMAVAPMPKSFFGKPKSGKDNPNYKHGKSIKDEKYSPKYKVRKQVIERDGNWCLLCGKPPKGLHLHRVTYGAQGGKYEKENCVQLCNEDHFLIHSNKRLFQPLIKSYLKLAAKHQLESEPTEPPFYWYDWIKEFKTAAQLNGEGDMRNDTI